jgi:hypothetical protein
MYREHHNGQLTIEEFHVPLGGKLDSDNRWVIFSSLMPWVELEQTSVEGYFGSRKRKYSLDLIMPRLSKGAENSISMAFVVMCAEKIRRLLRLFFITIFVCIYAFQRPGSL